MKHPVNVLVLRLFAPILILVAMLGFVLPPSLAMTSGAPAYHYCVKTPRARSAAWAWGP